MSMSLTNRKSRSDSRREHATRRSGSARGSTAGEVWANEWRRKRVDVNIPRCARVPNFPPLLGALPALSRSSTKIE